MMMRMLLSLLPSQRITLVRNRTMARPLSLPLSRTKLLCYYTAAAAIAASSSSSSSSSCHAFSPPLWKHNRRHYQDTPQSPATSYSSTACYSTARTASDVASFRRTVDEVDMTTDALAMVNEAIQAVNPTTAIQRHVLVNDKTGILTIDNTAYYATNYDKIIIVAFGKASSAMAAACVQQLQAATAWKDLPLEGVVICKDGHATTEEYDSLTKHGVVVQEASHPVPDERSVAGARAIREMISSCAKEQKTLILCCLSGGGSSLFCEPLPPLTLDDLQTTNEALLKSGMDITDMNVIRKRCDCNKGGKLLQHASAAAANGASLVTLVLSDIIGDPLDLIASGPTVPDSSLPGDAWRLVQSNPVLRESLPAAVLQVLQDDHDKEEQQQREQADDDDDNDDTMTQQQQQQQHNVVLVGNNALAVQAAAEEAKRRGYNTIILGTRMEGETRHVASVYTSMAQHIARGDASNFVMARRPAALIAGGETTVTLPATSTGGKGGRNQEMALVAALHFQQLGLRNVVLASVGTDGTDGPTDAAGAVVDGATILRLKGSAEEALQRHNAYPYLDQMEEDGHSPLIKTGPTGTNVADVCVTLIR